MDETEKKIREGDLEHTSFGGSGYIFSLLLTTNDADNLLETVLAFSESLNDKLVEPQLQNTVFIPSADVTVTLMAVPSK